MTLRARLLLALLSLALLPTLVFTLFTLYELSDTTGRWHWPSVDRALQSGVEVSRTAITRLEATATNRTRDWAATVPPSPLDAEARARMRAALREAGLDFAQVYRLEHGRWRLVEQVTPVRVLHADSLDLAGELPAVLAGSGVLHSRLGALAAAARTPAGTALVCGIRLTPDFFARAEELGRARQFYPQLAVFADLQGRYVWLLVPALVAVVALAALLIARALAASMTRPLTSLTAAFGRVAAGELETRVPEEGAAELRALSAAFNTMTGRLAEARAAVARAEREAVWREVARQLAHEIKNPLTPMRLSLHRLQRRVDLVPEAERAAVRDSLEALLEEVEHLTRLAEHFSRYARLPEPHMAPLELGELARASTALHEPEQVRLSVHGGEPVRVLGDRLLLLRALHNLLLNACEASPAGTEVEVRTGASATQGWIEVLDRGPGIAPEVAARIFEPYVSTKNRGSGLGLSLVRDIARQHGGDATLANREGGGACARLTLPLSE